MGNRGRLSLVLLLALAASGPGFPQEVSGRKELAVFTLGSYRWNIPPAALQGIDERIRGVFVTLGRFSVIGMGYQLGEEDVGAFIESIKRFKSENVEIPETVQMGREFFTQADLNRLIASFIVVVPSVTDFRLSRGRDGGVSCAVRTSFTFVSVEELRAFAQFSIETSGSDPVQELALREALDAIPPRLTFEVRKIPEFQLKSGILEVRGAEVVLELGSDMGVRPGDEYLIVAPRVLASGKTVTDEKGLLVVRDVRADSSTATVIYSDGPPAPGDQLQELPRLGTDSTFSLRAVVWQPGRSQFALPAFAGIRQTLSRGFSAFRPYVGVEAPVHLLFSGAPGVPLNFFIGGEYDFSFGRLQVSPLASVGIGAYVSLVEGRAPVLSHAGGSIGVTVSYLFSRDMKWVAEAGWVTWLGLAGPTYGGVYAGGGITIKF